MLKDGKLLEKFILDALYFLIMLMEFIPKLYSMGIFVVVWIEHFLNPSLILTFLSKVSIIEFIYTLGYKYFFFFLMFNPFEHFIGV